MDTGSVAPEAVEKQLERILASETFRAAERSRTLLRFIVEHAVQGRAGHLKDYTLGSEALGRGAGFDPRTDPIARVEASRLRSRLEVYYGTEGANDEVRISLPKGGYAPVFETRPTVAGAQPADFSDALPIRRAGDDHFRSRLVRLRRLVVGLTIGMALSMAAAVWFAARAAPHVSRAEMRLEIATPLTSDPVSMAISPDGQSVAFVASANGATRLWVRRLESGVPRPLNGTEDASFPFWAPDGRALGFFADARVKRIDLDTGLVRVISTAVVPAGGAWSRDGVILHPIVPDGGLFKSSVSGGPLVPATQLAPGQTGHRGPTFLPDGRHFLFYAMGSADARGVYVGELGTTTTRRLLDADAPAVLAAPEHLLYVQNSTLFARRLDPLTLALAERPIRVADGIAIEPSAGMPALAAATGTIIYRTGLAGGQRQFIWVDREGHERSRLGPPESRTPSYASMSLDGRRLAVQRSVDGNTDIYVMDAARGQSVRMTGDPEADIAPVWSPRGDRVAYASRVKGVFQLFARPPDDGPAALLVDTPQPKQATDWSRDGRYLLYRTVSVTPHFDMDIWAMPLAGDGKPFAVVRTPSEERDAQFSPNGGWIAYQSNESGPPDVYLRPFPGPGERIRISTGGGVQARWRSDGRELFYLTLNGMLMSVPIGWPPGQPPIAGTPTVLFPAQVGPVQGIALHSYLVSQDGQQFLLDRVIDQVPPAISVILNWNASDR